MCDGCCVCVVHRAAAAYGGEGGDRQSLLDQSADVLYCLGDQGALSLPFLLCLTWPHPLSATTITISFLHHFQLSAGCGFRGAALPLAEGRVSYGGTSPLTASRLIGGRLRLFGLTGSNIVMVTAPRDFGRAVRIEKAKRERGCCGITKVKPLCDSGDNFLSLLQQRANQRVCLSCSRPWGGTAGRLCQGDIFKSPQRFRDGPL